MSDPLAKIAASVFELEPAQIHDGLSPDQVGTWDSFNHVMLITQIEEELHVRFEPKELTTFKTIGDIRTHLRKRGVAV